MHGVQYISCVAVDILFLPTALVLHSLNSLLLNAITSSSSILSSLVIPFAFPSLLPSPPPLQAKPTTLPQEPATLNPSVDASDAATASSPSQPLHTTSPHSGVSRTPSKPSPLTTSVNAAPQQTRSGGDTDVEMASAKGCDHDNLYDHVVLDMGQESNKSTTLMFDTSAPVQTEEDQQAEPSHSNAHISGGGIPSMGNDPFSLVMRIFSSWPCIVATVLGYIPNCIHSSASVNEQRGGSKSLPASGEGHMKPGHVTVLDAFLQKLLYSTHTQLISTFLTTIIEKITDDLRREEVAGYFQKEDGSYSFEEIPLHEGTVGLVVGSVLIRAIIRLLTVEHSRPLGASTTSLHRATPNEASGIAEEEDLDLPPPPGRRQQLCRDSSMEEKAQNVYSIIR